MALPLLSKLLKLLSGVFVNREVCRDPRLGQFGQKTYKYFNVVVNKLLLVLTYHDMLEVIQSLVICCLG